MLAESVDTMIAVHPGAISADAPGTECKQSLLTL